MSGMGQGVKFTSSTSGHTHQDTPKVHYGPVLPPVVEANLGDTWVETA